MLALPSLAGAPAIYQGIGSDAIAAQCAIALAKKRPLVAPSHRKAPLEQMVFADTLKAWLDEQTKGLRVFDFSLHVATGHTDENIADSQLTIFVSNDPQEIWHQVWCLERRWKEIERAAPGLARSALFAIGQAHVWAMPIFTPDIGFGFAVHYHWRGEMDETDMLAEAADNGEDVGDLDIFRRADFDKAIPEEVTFPKILPRGKLERLAKRRGPVGTIAELTLGIVDAVRAARRHADKVDMTFSSGEDEGEALAFSIALRWNTKDPLPGLCDDHLEYVSQMGGNDTLGWFCLQPRQIPAWIAQMERRFAIIRLIDRLVPLIAVRQGSR
ncbi:MAG TPA: PRTRC system protein F [Burkholderiales bacterium]|nr:PRTRC system protein F [Burkholderiales bacterium]